MTLVLADRVKETTTTTGTGTLTLGGAVTAFRAFSVIGNGNTCHACVYAVDSNGNPTGAWEVFLGTYTLSGTTLSRDAVISSSNGGSAVSFAAGTKHVILTIPASVTVTTAGVQTLTNKTINAASNTISNLATSMFAADVVDTDGTLAANSDTRIASQKAVKAYVGSMLVGLWQQQGTIDCSANPNYPVAAEGDVYMVSVAGKIGGALGADVAAGDVIVAIANNTGGSQASVGTSWNIIEHNLPTLAAVATSGDYDDLSNTPDLSAYALLSGATFVGGISSPAIALQDGTPSAPAVGGSNETGKRINLSQAGQGLSWEPFIGVNSVGGKNQIWIKNYSNGQASSFAVFCSNGAFNTSPSFEVTEAGVAFNGAAVPASVPAANQSMTDSTAGSASTTLGSCGDTTGSDQSGTINNNFASVNARLAEIRSLLTALGLGV